MAVDRGMAVAVATGAGVLAGVLCSAGRGGNRINRGVGVGAGANTAQPAKDNEATAMTNPGKKDCLDIHITPKSALPPRLLPARAPRAYSCFYWRD